MNTDLFTKKWFINQKFQYFILLDKSLVIIVIISDLFTQIMCLSQSFVHLSTAFCHCDYDVLEEKVYPSPANPEDVIRAVEWMDDTTLETIMPK